MLSSVLRSRQAILVNIQIMRAFVMLKRTGLTYATLKRKIEEMGKKYDSQFRVIFQAIQKLIESEKKEHEKIEPRKRPIGFHRDRR